ncbi:hypothetical protein JWH04_18270, partial [Xanthomonas melonis]|uniref:hypothetical protein n=1 Tax=Xanthomonas melonis TaxID=56456 RepID=UPI001E417AD7
MRFPFSRQREKVPEGRMRDGPENRIAGADPLPAVPDPTGAPPAASSMRFPFSRQREKVPEG